MEQDKNIKLDQKQSKVIVLQGPPASGKSTWAREFVTGKTDWVIVNRGSLRNMCGDYWIPSREDYITILEENSVTSALSSKYNVIIDATNLNFKTITKWKEIAKIHEAKIEFKAFYIPFEEAVERDSKREKPVGKKVIKRFYRMYYKDKFFNETSQTVEHPRIPINDSLPKAVICDIDGTIAWMQERSPYDYSKVIKDKHDPRLVQLIKILQETDVEIIFLSGREGNDQCKQDTLQWLSELFPPKKKMSAIYPSYTSFQRNKGDFRPDEIIKRELYDQFIKDKYDVICVFDDRDKVVNMWREIGLLCCQVNKGDF